MPCVAQQAWIAKPGKKIVKNFQVVLVLPQNNLEKALGVFNRKPKN